MAGRISPGFLTASEAAVLSEAVALAERTHRALMDLPVEKMTDEFPARLTSWDSGTQRAAWTEEAFDASGQRYVKPEGRTGTTAWMPAVPVGNGLMPPDAFPVQVWLRRRDVTDTLGPVYEFDWVCACAGSGSGTGSGSGNGDILTSCCAGALPHTLTATFTQTAGAACALDGQTATLTYFTSSTWRGSVTAAGHTWTTDFTCQAAGNWSLNMTASGGVTACDMVDTGGTTVSCSPLQVTFSASTAAGCTNCVSGTFTITVTE